MGVANCGRNGLARFENGRDGLRREAEGSDPISRGRCAGRFHGQCAAMRAGVAETGEASFRGRRAGESGAVVPAIPATAGVGT